MAKVKKLPRKAEEINHEAFAAQGVPASVRNWRKTQQGAEERKSMPGSWVPGYEPGERLPDMGLPETRLPKTRESKKKR